LLGVVLIAPIRSDALWSGDIAAQQQSAILENYSWSEKNIPKGNSFTLVEMNFLGRQHC
jgi:hypothetical protein